MAKKGLLRGGKFSMTHSTVIEAAEQFLMGAKGWTPSRKSPLGSSNRVRAGLEASNSLWSNMRFGCRFAVSVTCRRSTSTDLT